MKKLATALALLPFCLQITSTTSPAQEDFVTKTTNELRQLAQEHAASMRLVLIGKSRTGRPILIATIGRASDVDVENRRSLLLVAGMDGRRRDDVALAMSHIRSLVSAAADTAIAKSLTKHTIHVLAMANPDGLARGIEGNGAPFDEDRDGREGEDGADDLDGDGKTVWMRIKDKRGTWIIDPDDSRLMRKAEPARGERGIYKLMREGEDDDKDGVYNEDGKGGVLLERNFPQLYPEHEAGAGSYALSESETLSLVKFITDEPGIGLILCYGQDDNLLTDPSANKEKGRASPKGVLTEDLWIYKELGKSYREITGRKGKNHGEWPGRFVSWAYAHAGIPTLATRIAHYSDKDAVKQKAPVADAAGTKEGKKERKKSDKNKDAKNEDAKKLAWLQEHWGEGSFVPWHEVKLADGKSAEIGGMVDALLHRIPQQIISKVTDKHMDFVLSLLGRLAAPDIAQLSVKKLARDVLEVKALVSNEGWLPPRTEMASKLRRPRPPRLEFMLKKGGKWQRIPSKGTSTRLLFGRPMQLMRDLKGMGSSKELRWVLKLGADVEGLELRLIQEKSLCARKEVKIR